MVLRVAGRSLPSYVQQTCSHGGSRELLHDVPPRIQHIHGHRQLPDSNNVHMWSQPCALSHCSEALPGADRSEVPVVTIHFHQLQNVRKFSPQWS